MLTEKIEPNYFRIIGIILIIGILICVVIPWNIVFPKKPEPIVNNTVIVIQKEYITVKITPTPDEGFYYQGEYDNGTRKLNRPFTWIRPNVSGYKDMKVSVRVYNYRLMDSYLWFNVHDYKYYQQYPTDENNQFLFIFINIVMDDIEGDDTRLYLPSRDHYVVQINNNLYPPIEYPLDLRIKELEETYDYNDVSRVKAYGQFVYTETIGSNAGQQSSINVTYLRGGVSNSEDGYIIYEIPKNTPINNILVLGQFYSFGNAQWRLSKR